MLAKDWLKEVEALAPYVAGRTFQVGAQPHGSMPGSTFVPWRQGSVAALDGIDSASADVLLAVFELEAVEDPFDALRQWARVVKEGGRVAVVLADGRIGDAAPPGWLHRFTPDHITAVITRVGGFEIVEARPVVEGRSWLLVLERSAVAEVRMPLGSVGPEIAEKVAARPELRAELRFQTASMLLASGDAGLAEPLFRAQLAVEPESADAHFGIGMSLGMQGRWAEALAALERSLELQPGSAEVERWIAEARQRAAHTLVRPAAPPAAATPAPPPAHPSPAGT